MKSSYRCSKGPEWGGLRPLGLKVIFPGLWDLIGQTLLQVIFQVFLFFFLQVLNVYLYSKSFYTCRGGQGMQKTEKWGLAWSWEEPSGLIGFPIALTIHWVYKCLFAHLNFSESGADCCHVTKTAGWQKSCREESYFAEAEGTLSTCATIFVDSFGGNLAWWLAGELPWCLGSVLLMWASVLMTAILEGKRIILRRSFTCCPFFGGTQSMLNKKSFSSITSPNHKVL